MKKAKLGMIISLAVSLAAVFVASVSTFSWFQINSAANPNNLAATKAVQTSATVYQNNAHGNDDDYQTSPTSDNGGTLSYDHSQGGKATNYFIREYNSSGVEVNTTQMYTNTANLDDHAALFNFTFTTASSYCFKIYNASTNDYYGYSAIMVSSPVYGDFSSLTAGGYGDNISLGTAGTYYDFFLTNTNAIYIKRHGEVTTSDEMGNESGWYICGNNSSDPNSSLYGMDGTVTTGIPMYVNAAKASAGSEDEAYYAGLRVSPGDVFWIMSGDDLDTKYTTQATGSDSNFTHNASGITVGSEGLGYYTLALNHSREIYIHEWDGMEVDSTTQYTAEVPLNSGSWSKVGSITTPKSAKSGLTQSGFPDFGIEIKNSGGLNTGDQAKWYAEFKTNSSSSGVWKEILNWGYETIKTWTTSDDANLFNYDYLKIHRQDSSGNDWNTWEISSGLKSYNYILVDRWPNNWPNSSGSSDTWSKQTKSILTIKYVDSSGTEIKPSSTVTCWNQNAISAADDWVSTPSITGFTFGGWYNAATGGSTVSTSDYITKNATIYARYTGNTVNLHYDSNGFDVDGGTTTTTAGVYNSGSTTVTWSNVSFASGSGFYLNRSTPSSYWKANNMTSGSTYFGADASGNNNFKCYYKGTYTIVLTLSNGHVDITMNTIDATQFYPTTNGAGEISTYDTCTANGDYTIFTITNVVIPQRGILFHVRDSKSSGYAVWGGKKSPATTVSANFTEVSDVALDSYYEMTTLYQCKVNITFTLTDGITSCTVVSNSVEQYPAQFVIQNASGTQLGSTTTYNSTNKYVMTNVPLNAGEEFGIKVLTRNVSAAIDAFWGFDSNFSSPSIIVNGTASCSKADYFAQGSTLFNNSEHYIKAKYHGTYTFRFNLDTHQITYTSITLNADNFMLVGYGKDFGNYAAGHDFNEADAKANTGSTGSNSLSFPSFRMKIGDRFKFKDKAGNLVGFDKVASSAYKKYFKSGTNSNINSRVDLSSVTVSVTFTPTNPANSVITITNASENTNITFKHARSAGIYIEMANNSSFNNSTVQMMHTTSNDAYRVQEAPVNFTAGTYFRIFETHSNTTAENDTLTSDAAIRAATETYYYTMANSFTGFTQNASSISAASGRWTISLTTSNTVHIDNYSGASTQSTQHLVSYYLIGRGMPGSEIRGCDFTPSKGVQMYTWGNNTSNLGCYVGLYPEGNTSPSKYKGTGINLKAGDTFTFSTASKKITKSQSAVNNDNYSITAAGLVTINKSGRFYVWLSGTEDNEVINLEYVSAGSSSTRSGDIVATMGEKGNVLSFGANLDYSLLDACGKNGYTFVVCLAHTSSSAGNITYNIANSNSYSIKVAKFDGSYDDENVYTGEQTIEGSGSYNSYTRAIAASSTTYTCIQVTIPADQIKSMISSGNYTFSMTINYSFVETTIS